MDDTFNFKHYRVINISGGIDLHVFSDTITIFKDGEEVGSLTHDDWDIINDLVNDMQ